MRNSRACICSTRMKFFIRILCCLASLLFRETPAAHAESCRQADGGVIQCGETVEGSVATSADRDEYTFSLPASGDISIRIQAAGQFTLFDQCGAQIGTSRNQGVREYSLPTGDYKIRVENIFGAGTYHLSLQGISELVTCGERILRAHPVLSTLDCLGDTDVYNFEAEPNDNVQICLNTGLVCVRLFDPAGFQVGSLCTFGPACKNFQLASIGTHTILAEPNASSQGSYTLDLTDNSQCLDTDLDGTCDNEDSCPSISNPDQQDTDQDGHGDACDCLPQEGDAFQAPDDVDGLAFGCDRLTMNWNSLALLAGPATVYDFLSGRLDRDSRGVPLGLPVGAEAAPGGTDPLKERCLLSAGSYASVADSTDPPVGSGFWYLVRGRNGCGIGTYGFSSTGSERVSSTCQ